MSSMQLEPIASPESRRLAATTGAGNAGRSPGAAAPDDAQHMPAAGTGATVSGSAALPDTPDQSVPLAKVYPFPDRRGQMTAQDKEAGMATAEYAIATLAAVAFAALLVAVLSSGDVRELLMSLIRAALSFG
ncbi:hypothetical protein GCM10009636_07120 [Arthrobacter koreensis]|uniref:DUF4244 domain-containing protein n=1 Tax=Arthrobacter koreensis TaxID=199136 RepID=UPI000AC5840B|nr:DUF4244 domain-containing protein [Arthrobacter koreensis]